MAFVSGARRRPSTGAIAAIVVALLAVAVWRLTQRQPASDLRLTPLTFDPGVNVSPAISPDGRLVAFASDRDNASRLDLYAQQLPRGAPVRLTTTTADDESEPAFSSDGATLAYRSSRDGGGIYTMPALGGDARLLAAGGRTPRYSPDGRSIAYRKGDDTSAAAFVMAANGGTPRPFHPEFAWLRSLAWSPDGGSLVFWGQRAANAAPDLWAAPLDGGTPRSTGLLARMAKANLGPAPVDDAIWTTAGLVFSARTGFVRNLYWCALDRDGMAGGDVQRLTGGTELMGDPSVSREGHLVFSSARQRFDVWGLPLEGNNGKATGAPYRITDTLAPTANPDLSPDGRRLLFGSSRNGFTQLWEKDLGSGHESIAATSAEGAGYGRFLRTGNRIVLVQPFGWRDDAYLLDRSNGQSRKLAAGARPWDVDANEQTVLLSGTGIDAMDLKSSQRATVLRAPDRTALSHGSFSPDGRWILFLAGAGPQSARIYVAPTHGLEEIPSSRWLPVTDTSAGAGNPRFWPDGRLIYFTLDHAGTRSIEAVRFDPQTGQTSGPPFPVFDPRARRLSLYDVNPLALDIAVARDKLVMILSETTSTIWMGDLVPRS